MDQVKIKSFKLTKTHILCIITGLIILLYTCFILLSIFFRNLPVFGLYSSLSRKVIAIDPGHGGIDGGANHSDGTLEKNINLQVALKLKNLLEKSGANVVMTRSEDTALDHLNKKSKSRHKRDLIARSDIINKTDPDIFLSIHVNADKSCSNTSGPMVFYHRESDKSRRIAAHVQEQLEDAYLNEGYAVRRRRAQPNSSLFLLCKTKCPGVIIELGFMTNPRDRSLLKNKQFQDKLCQAILIAIENCL